MPIPPLTRNCDRELSAAVLPEKVLPGNFSYHTATVQTPENSGAGWEGRQNWLKSLAKKPCFYASP